MNKLLLHLLIIYLSFTVAISSFADTKPTDAAITNENLVIPPPIEPDTSPILRADQLFQQQKLKTEEKQETTTLGITQSSPSSSAQAKMKFSPQRKSTGLKITEFIAKAKKNPLKVQADQVLVRFKKQVSKENIKRTILQKSTSLIHRKTQGFEKIGFSRVQVPSGVTVADFLTDIKKDSNVEYAEPDFILRSLGEKPQDPSLGNNWALDAINAMDAWKITKGDPSIIVAVIDSGIAYDHPSLTDNLLPGYDFISDNTEILDDFGHGTQVAGIITSKYNEIFNTSGVAPESSLMPLKVLDANGEGTVSDVAEAIIYAADSGVRIILLAIGTYAESNVLKAAVEYAFSKNCIIIAAAGNNGTEEPCYPAAYPSTVAVTAVDQFNNSCFFSNKASYIDIGAPGRDVLTTSIGGGYENFTGTSAAAAYASALAALLVSQYPDETNHSIRARMITSALDLGHPGWDSGTGFGLIDCTSALSSANGISSTDVGIIDVSFLPLHPLPGQTVNISVTVRNHGSIAVSPCNAILEYNSQIVSTESVALLEPKQTHTIVFQWTSTSEVQAGVQTLLAHIAPLANEISTNDNSCKFDITLTNDILHDVGIIDYSISGLFEDTNSQLEINVTLANFGNQNEANILVKFFFEDIVIATEELVTMPVGSRTQISFPWSIPDQSSTPHDLSLGFMLHAYVIGAPNDVVESNNKRTLRLKFSNEFPQRFFPLHAVDSGKEVHQWIAYQAYQFFTSQVEGSSLPTYLAKPGLSISPSNWASIAAATHNYNGNNNILEGSRDEDKIGVPDNHLCAGAEGEELTDGWGVSPSAYTTANGYRSNNWTGNNALSFFYLGRYVHLLADMTVPAHTHNDEHFLPGDSEPYENAMADWYSDYDFKYNDSYGFWTRIIARPSSTESIFRATADYTEDYDSEDESGDWDGSTGQPFANSKHSDEMYYPTTNHKPSQVDGSGIYGMTTTECWITAKDLMPFAIFRTAQAYRYFFFKIDTSSPIISMSYPASEDIKSPTVMTSLNSFNLTTTSSDSQSGILKKGFQYKWAYTSGGSNPWSDWSNVSSSPTTNSVSFTPSKGYGYYAFYVIGENGGGLTSSSTVKYLRIQLSTYTVSYNANGATSGSVPTSQTKTHGVNLTLRTNTGNLARTGYTFAGWNTNTSGTGTDYAAGGTYTANASDTLYAKWTALSTYTVRAILQIISGQNPEYDQLIYSDVNNDDKIGMEEAIYELQNVSRASYGTVTSATGRIWMDRNLGASRVATSATDVEAYGDLYQWGRLADGHEKRTSATTTIISSTSIPNNGDFILVKEPWWDNRWTTGSIDISGANNPCPTGFRLPTQEEWQAEIDSWGSNSVDGAWQSPLKLVAAGIRSDWSGALSGVGTSGYYWSSTSPTISCTFICRYMKHLNFTDETSNSSTYSSTGSGACVRCINDE
jgi:uncharacterized protein (TIGR02145 family)